MCLYEVVTLSLTVSEDFAVKTVNLMVGNYWICSVRVTVPGYTAEESVRSVGILWPL